MHPDDDAEKQQHFPFDQPASPGMVAHILAHLELDKKPSSQDMARPLDQLERDLDHEDWQVRLRAVKLLRWKGSEAYHALLKATHDPREIVRMMARFYLQNHKNGKSE